MTLYYVKLGAAQITEALAEAQKKIGLQEQRNFVRFLQSTEHKSLTRLVASNDAAGITALHENTPGSWVIGDKGICPVGGTLCDKGGPKLSTNPLISDYAPTPGGPRNCVRCRFFITGPAFLGGLVVHFNATGVRLLAAAERFRAEEAAIRTLEDEVARTDDSTRRSSLMADLQAAHDHHQRGTCLSMKVRSPMPCSCSCLSPTRSQRRRRELHDADSDMAQRLETAMAHTLRLGSLAELHG